MDHKNTLRMTLGVTPKGYLYKQSLKLYPYIRPLYVQEIETKDPLYYIYDSCCRVSLTLEGDTVQS